jgi:hypothetical protein
MGLRNHRSYGKDKILTMAVPAPKGQNMDLEGKLPFELAQDAVRLHAAQLYGRGFRRPQIARALQQYLTARGDLKGARGKLAKWEKQQEFRDLIYENAILKTDLETPHILAGVTAAAKRGRVDAAKLALSLVGRYTDKSEMPAEVTLKLEGFVRPNDRQEPTSERKLHGRAALPPGNES